MALSIEYYKGFSIHIRTNGEIQWFDADIEGEAHFAEDTREQLYASIDAYILKKSNNANQSKEE